MSLNPQTFLGVPWRTVITTLNSISVTTLDRLASERTVEKRLDAPTQIRMHVPSDSFEVNRLRSAPDGRPLVSYSDRLCFMLRRDVGGFGTTPDAYTCRAAGIVMPLEDEGSDAPTSTFAAFDPWQLLYKRPVVTNAGVLPGPDGWVVKNRRGDQIVMDLLDNQAVFCAANPHSDAFIDRGQGGAFYRGTIHATSTIEAITFAQGSSVGEAFDQLCEARYLDIVLDPIYDPMSRPGLIAELSVHNNVGVAQNQAVMAWDKPSRSLTGISALYDGGALENKLRTYPGQGGPPIPVSSDATSANRYGEYWGQRFFTGQDIPQAVELLADAEIALQKDGKRTLSVAPAASRSPIPFIDYDVGDYLPVYASERLRQPIAPTQVGSAWSDLHRVWGMTINLGDDELEQVQLLLSKDG